MISGVVHSLLTGSSDVTDLVAATKIYLDVNDQAQSPPMITHMPETLTANYSKDGIEYDIHTYGVYLLSNGALNLFGS